MNFDFSEEQKLLQKTVRDYLAEHSPLQANRDVLENDATTHDAELWKGAAEMGWLGAAVPEEYGGAGFGHLELALIAEEVGRALAPIPFASSVYLASEALMEAGSDEQKKRWLPRLASGETIGTVAIAEPGDALPTSEGCAAMSESAPQLLFANAAVASAMMAAFYAFRQGALRYEEVYFDIATGRSVPVQRALLA